MYLNVGVGPLPIHPQHVTIMESYAPMDKWTLADLYVTDPGFKQWDATKLDEVPDGTVDVFYASHLLEHIPHTELVDVLNLWFRKIKPGGTLIINVPDMAWAAKQILKFESGQALTGLYAEFEGNHGLQTIIYGTYAHDGEKHQSAYTRRSLYEWLEGIGFKNIHIEEYYDAHEMGVLLATCQKSQ